MPDVQYPRRIVADSVKYLVGIVNERHDVHARSLLNLRSTFRRISDLAGDVSDHQIAGGFELIFYTDR